ncbi:hypothetical protein ES703_38827 [subsurface metagenome]
MNSVDVAALKNLKEQRRRLTKRIATIEKHLIEKEKAVILKLNYVKVVCLACNGLGMVTVGGADIQSDPPEEIPCTECSEKGFLIARKFDGECKVYKVGYDER